MVNFKIGVLTTYLTWTILYKPSVTEGLPFCHLTYSSFHRVHYLIIP